MALATTTMKKNNIFSKLSPWLGLGCLSPREVYWKMQEAEANFELKPYFNKIVLGQVWRDYYCFMFKKYRNTFFKLEGFSINEVKMCIRDSFKTLSLANVCSTIGIGKMANLYSGAHL